MKQESEQGKLDPKLKRQLIYLVLVLAVALIAAIAGSAAVAVQQSRVPWAESRKTTTAEVSVQAPEENDDDIDAATDAVDEDNTDLAATTGYRSPTSSLRSSSYRYRTYSYQYAAPTDTTR